MRYPSKRRTALLFAIIISLLSASTSTFVYAAPLSTSAKDWQYPNGNSWAWNYSPQTQITKDNVNMLEVRWIFPIESKSTAVAAMQSITREGATAPPIVHNGVVYVATQYQRTYAIDAATGKLLWKHDYVIDLNETEKRLPIIFQPELSGVGITPPHMHGFSYWEAGNALLLNGLACDMYGVDANTGKQTFRIQDLCLNVPGNIYKYRQGIVSTSDIGVYNKGRQFILVMPGAARSYILPGDARHVTMGVDMDTHQILWRVFSYPPQDMPTKDWALQECDTGYFQTTPCSDVAAKAPQNLEWDWAQPNEKPSVYGGVTANWGQIIVDEDTGVFYTQTGNQGPYTYVGTTPGPRLYGSTIMAIDMNAGKRIWWNQPFPRDPYGYDCSWSGILADTPSLGKVYVKGCGEGRLYVLNAATGKPLYVADVANDEVNIGQVTSAALKEPPQGGVRYHLTDPFNNYDMREMKSPDNSSYCGRPCTVFPGIPNGVFGTDMSYDPETQTLYHYANAKQTVIVRSIPAAIGVDTAVTTSGPPTNATIMARDVATGKMKWTWFYQESQQSSHMVVTSGMVFAGFTDGSARFFDKLNGKLLYKLDLGSGTQVDFTTGQDSKGDQMIFGLIGSSSSSASPSSPATLVAIGLSAKATQPTTSTSTTTSTTTTTTTVPANGAANMVSTITSTITYIVTAITTTINSQTTVTTTVTATAVATTAVTTTVTVTITSSAATTTTGIGGLPADTTYIGTVIVLVALAAAIFATRGER